MDTPVSQVDHASTLCRLLGAGSEAGPSLFEVARGAPGSPLLFTTQLGADDDRRARAEQLDGALVDLERLRVEAGVDQGAAAGPDPQALEAMRALGYVE